MYKAVKWNLKKNKQWSIVCHTQTRRQSKQIIKNASNDELQFGELQGLWLPRWLGNYYCQIRLKLMVIIVYISEEFRSHGLLHSSGLHLLIEIISLSIYFVKWLRLYFARVSLFGEICLFLFFWTLVNKQGQMTAPSNLFCFNINLQRFYQLRGLPLDSQWFDTSK